MPLIAESYENVCGRIAAAAARSGRDTDTIELVAVSKTWPAETVTELADCGHQLFGENRVQELEAKVPVLPSRLRWHFIGRLQKNKVRKVLPLVEAIHSVDSTSLAHRIDTIAADIGVFPKIYLQVNTGEEASKGGFTSEGLRADLEQILELPRLEVVGLMAIPPFMKETEEVRPHFIALRKLRDEVATTSGVPLPGLSMGMSNDFEIAIEEGATIVRVGSAIFGKRRPWGT